MLMPLITVGQWQTPELHKKSIEKFELVKSSATAEMLGQNWKDFEVKLDWERLAGDKLVRRYVARYNGFKLLGGSFTLVEDTNGSVKVLNVNNVSDCIFLRAKVSVSDALHKAKKMLGECEDFSTYIVEKVYVRTSHNKFAPQYQIYLRSDVCKAGLELTLDAQYGQTVDRLDLKFGAKEMINNSRGRLINCTETNGSLFSPDPISGLLFNRNVRSTILGTSSYLGNYDNTFNDQSRAFYIDYNLGPIVFGELAVTCFEDGFTFPTGDPRYNTTLTYEVLNDYFEYVHGLDLGLSDFPVKFDANIESNSLPLADVDPDGVIRLTYSEDGLYNPMGGDIFQILSAANTYLFGKAIDGNGQIDRSIIDYLSQSFEWTYANSPMQEVAFAYGGRPLLDERFLGAQNCEDTPDKYTEQTYLSSFLMRLRAQLGAERIDRLVMGTMPLVPSGLMENVEYCMFLFEQASSEAYASQFDCNELSIMKDEIEMFWNGCLDSNQTLDLTLPADLFIKDTYAGQESGFDNLLYVNGEDIGNEENSETVHFWVSPSIWNCSPDNLNCDEQTNAVYEGNSPNRLYVKVHNRGCEEDIEGNLIINVATANTQQSYLEGWGEPQDKVIFNPGSMQNVTIGKRIATIPLDQYEIDPLDPSVRVYSTDWIPFNPVEFEGLDDIYLPGARIHVCVLARIESEADPLYDDSGGLSEHLKNNNNIAMRNMTTIYVNRFEGPSSPVDNVLVVQVPEETKSCDNVSPTSESSSGTAMGYNLRMEVIPTDGVITYQDLAEVGDVSFKVGQKFREALPYGNEGSGTDMVLEAENLFKCSGPGCAFEGLDLLPQERYPIAVQFVPKSDKFRPVRFQLVLADANGCIVGGEEYVVRAATKRNSQSNMNDEQVFKDGQLTKISPNPVLNNLKLALKTGHGFTSLSIYSAGGIMVHQEKLSQNDSNITVNMYDLRAGIYFIEVKNGQGAKEFFRIVKI